MENALNGETTQVQFVFIDKDSDKVYVEGHTNYWLENGKPASAHAVLRTIKTRHKQEKMLKLSTTVFEHTNDRIFVTDTYGLIHMVTKLLQTSLVIQRIICSGLNR